MRQGVRIAVDVGSVRVGVARSDPAGMLATPVETVQRSTQVNGVRRVSELVQEWNAIEVVVGLPRSLDGKERAAAQAARTFARHLAKELGAVPIRLVDERLTTTSAQFSLQQAGRKARTQRGVIDQAAAVVLLQAALDEERNTGRPAGIPLRQSPAKPEQDQELRGGQS